MSIFTKTRERIGGGLQKAGNFVKSFAPGTATLGVIARGAGALSTVLGAPAPWLVGSGKLTTLIGGIALGIGNILNRAGDKMV